MQCRKRQCNSVCAVNKCCTLNKFPRARLGSQACGSIAEFGLTFFFQVTHRSVCSCVETAIFIVYVTFCPQKITKTMLCTCFQAHSVKRFALFLICMATQTHDSFSVSSEKKFLYTHIQFLLSLVLQLVYQGLLLQLACQLTLIGQ